MTFLLVSLSGTWTFCEKHPGILLVVIGVAGEILAAWNRPQSTREALEKIFGIVLVAGLVLEMWEAVKEDKEVAALQLSTANVELANSQLRSKVVEMVRDEEPWHVGDEILGPLGQVHGANVLLANIPDHNAGVFADELALLFWEVHWNCSRITTLRAGLDGVRFAMPSINDHGARDAAILLKKELAARDIPTFWEEPRYLGLPMGDIPSNSVVVVVGKKPEAWALRVWLARVKAADARGEHKSPEAISNAWHEVFNLEMEHRRQQIDLGVWSTNAPVPRFFPGGYAGDGTPLGMDGKPILEPAGKPKQ